MRLTETFDNLIEKLKSKEEYFDENGELLKSKVIYDAQNDSEEILDVLLSDEKLTEIYFKTVRDTKVFLKDKLINTINHKEFFPSSYTSYLNYIGLSDGTDFIKKSKDVVLNFPYKDCILEGGQSKDEQSLKEFFYNDTLANDEVDRLLHPKVLTNIKKYTKDGEEENPSFKHTDNLLVKGNNLIALHSLSKRYEGRIKLIYIDPPYNTGKDSFGYNDKFNHSSWLTFIKNRLDISEKLLDEDGVIFVSCDDNEYSYLKVLMDEVFLRKNYLGTIVWQTATDNNPSQIKTEHEYIIGFAKNKEKQKHWISTSMEQQRLQTEYERLKDLYSDDIETIQKELRKFIKQNKDLLDRVTHYDNVDEKGVFHDADVANTKKGGYKYEIIHPITNKVCKIPDYGFRYPKETMDEMIRNNDIVFGEDENTLIKPKKRLSNVKDTLRSVIYEDGRKSTKELEDMFYRGVFKNPKSPTVLKRLFSFVLNDGDICLDFFSGSATTAQSVIDLNSEDNGNRKFILIEQMDYIDTLTKERIVKSLGKNDSNSSFTYMELRKNNQLYIDTITECTTSEQLIEIKNELKDSNFIRYEVKDENLFDDNNQFDILSVDEQKEILIKILDKNHLYVNYSEIDDSQYDISDEDKKFNREFYEVK